jgi:lipopolysaccharide export system protein LptA
VFEHTATILIDLLVPFKNECCINPIFVPAMKKIFLFLLLFIPLFTIAQKRVTIKHSDDFKGSIKDGVRIERLIGHVHLVQNTTTIYCDSAWVYRSENRVEGFGRVRIIDGDSVDCTSNGLSYDGNRRLAKLRRNVVFSKLGIAKLYTDNLDYDRPKGEARYFNGGKLVDSINTLTSSKGYYQLSSNLASFKKNVEVVNPDYTMKSDTLQYNSKTKIVYFRDSTVLVDKEGGSAVYKSGTYNTVIKSSNLNKGVIETPEFKIVGEKYFIDDAKKTYKSKGNVVMTSKEDNLIIYGDDIDYNKKKGISKVYGHAFAAKVGDNQDTLYISADTLVSIENKDTKKKRLLAYRHVKIFKSDLQGLADSLAYSSADSTIRFFKDPVLWAEENQMTSDSIRILLKKKKIDKLYLVGNSFVASQDSMKNFNQIKGRKMTANFDGKNIKSVIVQGNGESIYYALQETEPKADSLKAVSETMGMNKIICSNMKINFVQGKVNNITFLIKPDASFIPPHELKDDVKKLKGFSWRGEARPSKKSVVLR